MVMKPLWDGHVLTSLHQHLFAKELIEQLLCSVLPLLLLLLLLECFRILLLARQFLFRLLALGQLQAIVIIAVIHRSARERALLRTLLPRQAMVYTGKEQ